MKSLLLLLLSTSAYATTATVTVPPTFDLYKGSTLIQPRVTRPTFAECVEAGRLLNKGDGCQSRNGKFKLTADPVPPVAGKCGMQMGTPVFCDTFDAPKPSVSRAGDLDAVIWGVSRATGEVNFGQGAWNRWNATPLVGCDGTHTVIAPHDVVICNGQLREAVNDNNTGEHDAGTVTVLAMYPKQPFDFAGRTGTVSFDVSNDTAGTHAAWPEFWMSNLPIPAPFNHFDSWQSLPQHGFGIRLSAGVSAGSQGDCPNATNIDKARWTVDSAAVVRDYVLDDTQLSGFGTRSKMAVKILDCVTQAPLGTMNHVEIKVAQSQIDVYASDAGSTVLKHIAVVTDANLTLTRGLIWIEHANYNADKSTFCSAPCESQKTHTFAWDNVAFDGPFTYKDLSFDALDNNVPGPNGSLNLAKVAFAGQYSTWDVLGLPANPQAAAVRVLFNFNGELRPIPSVLNVIVNGHKHSVPWPYPDKIQYTWRTFAVTIPITDLVAGTNAVQLGADTDLMFANVNIVLVDAK